MYLQTYKAICKQKVQTKEKSMIFFSCGKVQLCRILDSKYKLYLMVFVFLLDLENRFVVANVEGKGVGWMGCLGLIDSGYCLWNELAKKSCHVALETMSGHIWSMIM